MAASKHTHARALCSNVSVGLTQARPNKLQSICHLLNHRLFCCVAHLQYNLLKVHRVKPKFVQAKIKLWGLP